MTPENLERELQRADDALRDAIDKLCLVICLVLLFAFVGKLWVFSLVIFFGWLLKIAIESIALGIKP